MERKKIIDIFIENLPITTITNCKKWLYGERQRKEEEKFNNNNDNRKNIVEEIELVTLVAPLCNTFWVFMTIFILHLIRLKPVQPKFYVFFNNIELSIAHWTKAQHSTAERSKWGATFSIFNCLFVFHHLKCQNVMTFGEAQANINIITLDAL